MSQSNSKENEIQKQNIQDQPPPEIPENIKKQDKVVKQIYSLQRELRDLKIQDFINDINLSCQISDKLSEVRFILEQKSGMLIEYKVDGKKIHIPCIDERLKRNQRNFGEMSYGFNNAFRTRPTSEFVILPTMHIFK